MLLSMVAVILITVGMTAFLSHHAANAEIERVQVRDDSMRNHRLSALLARRYAQRRSWFDAQPLVENAVRHGIAPRVTPGILEVETLRENGRLVLEVRDDGPGFGSMDPEGAGVGLTTTRRRLEALYGDGQSLRLDERPGGGALVRIELPARVPGDPTAAPVAEPMAE